MFTRPKGPEALDAVASRVVKRYLERQGRRDVVIHFPPRPDGIEITYERLGQPVGVKIKSDPYYGVDEAKCADRSLPFYRCDAGEAALQSVAHHLNRDPGWAVTSSADELFYYVFVIDQTEDQVVTLLEQEDDVFFKGIRIVRDDLRIVPMAELNRWFVANQDDYTTRPITVGDHSAWYRIVPRVEFDQAVPGVVNVGSIFAP